MVRGLLLALLVVAAARADVKYVVTNGLNFALPDHQLSVGVGERLRYTVQVVDGSNMVSLAGNTIRFVPTDIDDGWVFPSIDGEVVPGTTNRARLVHVFTNPLTARLDGTVYLGASTVVLYRICSDLLQVVPPMPGADITISNSVNLSSGAVQLAMSAQIPTARVEVVVNDGVDTVAINGHTSNSFNLAVSGGGIGVTTNLETGTFTVTNRNIFTAPAGYPSIAQSDGAGNYYWGVLYGPPPVVGVGTNERWFTNLTAETFIIPAGNTWWEFTGAGGVDGSSYKGSAGGKTMGLLTVPAGTLVEVIASTTGNGTNGGFFGGGKGISRGAISGMGGGGLAGLRFANSSTNWSTPDSLTNWLIIAPGGVGGIGNSSPLPSPNFCSPGGGYRGGVGYANTNAAISYAGNQLSVYGGVLTWATNSAGTGMGAYLVATSATNVANSAVAGLSGGGGGYLAGCGSASTLSNASMSAGYGSPGTGWVNSNYVTFASTVRSASQTNAPDTDLPWYLPGKGAAGNDGFGYVRY